MSVSENLDLHGARWSLVCFTGCARAGLYGHQDAPQDELTPDQRQRRDERFQLGHDLSDKHRARDVAVLEAEGWECVVEGHVEWPAANPIGVGHADLIIAREDDDGMIRSRVVEYTTAKGAVLGEHKALQCAGYAENTPSVEAATVVSIDPTNGHVEHYPLDLEGLTPRVREMQAAVVEAIEKGEADRVCSFPGEGKKRGCPFAEHCFRDWTPPETDHLMPVLDEKLLSLAEAEDAYAEAKAVYDDADEARKALREELRPYLPTGQDVVGAVGADASAVKVKVSVSYRTTFSLSDATKAGHEIPERLQAFVKTSAPIEKWTIRRIPGASR